MRFTLVISFLFLCTVGFGQSSSSHYKSAIRGSLTSGGLLSTSDKSGTTVSIWTEGHKQTSTSYVNTSIGSVGNSGPDSSSSSVIKLGLETVTIFPNPSTSWFHIKADFVIDEVNVWDASGRKVPVSLTSTELDASKWSRGVYFLTVRSGSKQLTTRLVRL
ncbi:MAG: T9SS type A sorting domain-containing protein [Bacteroidia bacterium]|nr:T9SS type A sorting domain-containing protein [Bacteroidia bacterium]